MPFAWGDLSKYLYPNSNKHYYFSVIDFKNTKEIKTRIKDRGLNDDFMFKKMTKKWNSHNPANLHYSPPHYA